MKKYYEITVKGRGQFPFDMLRYSRCWPVTTEDAENIPDYTKRRTIKLGMIGNYTEADHCVARFKSFGIWTAEITQEERL